MTSEVDGSSPNRAHYGKLTDPRLTADEMDERRTSNLAYEYLCHLEEAKLWMENCIEETMPPTTELEESLRNGVSFAKLGHFMCPEVVPMKKIYDKDQTRHQIRGLHFRHTDNINHFRLAMKEVGLPEIFWPETTDVYDKKNMPRVIYCIHALSLYLFKLGKAPQIQDLYGKIMFTEEEISAMSKELEKYGIQMPSFGKIGGILANEMPVDEAALHAAVIAINEAVEQQVAEDTLHALQIPAAHLSNINEELQHHYQHTLFTAKAHKGEVTRNKSEDPDYIPDVYDELLTQAEIQGNINKVNTEDALSQLMKALQTGDLQRLLTILTNPPLALRDVRRENAAFYQQELINFMDNQQINNNHSDGQYAMSRDDAQRCVNSANIAADSHQKRAAAVQAINEALDHPDPSMLMQALQNPAAELPPVLPHAAELYHQELRSMKAEKGEPLNLEEIVVGVNVLTAIAEINRAIDTGSASAVLEKLRMDDSCIAGVDETLKDKYFPALLECKLEKAKNAEFQFLVYSEIQDCVDQVNRATLDESLKIEAIHRINVAIDEGADETLEALCSTSAGLSGVSPQHAVLYHSVLSKRKKAKVKETNDPTAELWYGEIQDGIDDTNEYIKEGLELSLAVAYVNAAVDSEDVDQLRTALSSAPLALSSFLPECTNNYLTQLTRFKQQKTQAGECGSGWMMNRLRGGHKFFFNVLDPDQFSWERTEDMIKDHSLLTKEDVQGCLSEVTAAYDRELLFKSNEPMITKLQAAIRGHMTRRRVAAKRNFLFEQLPAIEKLQSWWRMVQARRRYLEHRSYFKENEDAVVTLQATMRGLLARKRYKDRKKYLHDNEKSVVRIQSFIRSRWAANDFRALMYSKDPPLNVVRKFVHLLDLGDQDYTEEIELQTLRQQVVQEIRSNKQLEADLDQMDIKIGLLVKNRITLQEVVLHHRSLKKYREQKHDPTGAGLKTLSRQNRERVEAYQHLFYLLQTNPRYLAHLIFLLPPSQTNRFMESVILTLYNYASNQREEYLLLRLFKTALIEEIRSKVDKMAELSTGNPLVVKMIVSFNRNARGQGALRELLQPLVKTVLDNKNLQINTNPVEVYKGWISQTETETGQPSGLPYEVSTEQALKHPEVHKLLQSNIKMLQLAADSFLESILNNVDKIPYGMRYMAKVMHDALQEKFPGAPEKDILKVVGNLIYYRYINSAIVAPDAFDIIDVSAQNALSNEQRRNLGSIAKILQFAAANKGFGGDNSHLADLNPYIMNAHLRFRKYLQQVCDVEEPEQHFNMDQYSDVVRVSKPVIYISVGEVLETHRLLLEHQDTLAPDVSDPLHLVLEELGETLTPEGLVGDSGVGGGDEYATLNRANVGKTEVHLTLSNKFEIPEDDKTDMHTLLIRTKRMIIDVIRCQRSGDNLTSVLNKPVLPREEAEHEALVRQRQKVDLDASRRGKVVRPQSFLEDTKLSLEELKQKIKENLQQLEAAGLVTRTNHYQDIINAIAQDIRNQRGYRQRRKQEMRRLRETLESLALKRKFYEEQIDYYNQYVVTCLDNLSAKTKKGRKGSEKGSKTTKTSTIKYSAAKLHEKGVVLEIEGLPTSQFKNVLFEISSTPNPAVFEVNCKFMGVTMEKVELVFQDLLQLQYEGVAVMEMFDRAKVNVNLLIFLINHKFYGKGKAK